MGILKGMARVAWVLFIARAYIQRFLCRVMYVGSKGAQGIDFFVNIFERAICKAQNRLAI
jgi:hypothetical protein